MRASVQCPNPECRKTYPITPQQAGRKARCKVCGTEFLATPSQLSEESSEGASPSVAAPARESLAAGPSDTQPAMGLRASRKPPTQLGRFQVLDLLGGGAFGDVYLARDPQLDRDVALKLLRRTGLDKHDQPRIDRFLIEGRAAARLQHPNIVPVFDAGRDEATGEYYQAAAFIRGQPLSSVIEGPMDPRRAATIVRKLAEALDYAHRQGILHRDVKPDNVMLDENDEPHLMDFGLARIAESEEHLTKDGTTLGTPAYMSPEQGSGKHTELTGSSDQYSLGCVLYELLTGQTPFGGPPAIQIHLHLTAEPEPPSKSQPSISKDLETVCLKSLRKDSLHRYADCLEFANDLHRWIEGEPIRARRMAMWELGLRWTRRNPLVAGLSIGTLVLLLVIAVISTGAAIELKRLSDKERQAKKEAQLSEQKEKDAARIANEERIRANEQARIAQHETSRTRELLYSADMNLAKRAWDDGHAAAMKSYLNQYVPQDGQPEVRGFEWFYLNRLINEGVTSFPAGTRVTSLGFTPDGLRLVSIGDENVKIADALHTQHVLKIWNKTTRECIRTIPLGKSGSWYPSQRVAISPDGSLVAVAAQTPDTFAANSTSDWRYAISIFDLASGALRTTLALGKETAHHIDWRHDGKQLLTVSNRNDWLRLWDVETAKQVVAIPKTQSRGPAWFMNGRNVEIAACDGRDVVCFDLTGKETRRMRGPPGNVIDLAFDAGQNTMATHHMDGTVRVWSTSTSDWKELRPLKGNMKEFYRVHLTPDGQRILMASQDEIIRVWRVDTGEEEFVLKGNEFPISTIAVNPDSRSVASGDNSGQIRLWELRTQAKAEYVTLRDPNDRQHHQCYLSADGQLVACCFTDRIEILDTSTRQLIRRIEDLRGDDGNYLRMMGQPQFSLSGNGKALAMTSSLGEFLRVWETSTGKRILHLPNPNSVIPENANSVAPLLDFTLSPDGTQAVFHFLFSFARFEIPSGQLKDVRPFNSDGHWSSPRRSVIVFSPDGTLAAMPVSSTRFGNDVLGTALFRVSDWQQRSLVKVHGMLAMSHNQRWVAIPGAFGVTLYDTSTGNSGTVLTGHNARVTAVSFLPGDTRIATASEDGTVKIWNPINGREMLTLEGSRTNPHTLVFSSDGTRLILLADGTERIWESGSVASAPSK